MVEVEAEESIRTALKRKPTGLHIAALAEKTGFSRTTISKYVAVMEERGEVEIESVGPLKMVRRRAAK